MTKSYNIHQDEDLTFPVLDSDFDNSIMQTSLTSDLNFAEKSRYWVLTEAILKYPTGWAFYPWWMIWIIFKIHVIIWSGQMKAHLFYLDWMLLTGLLKDVMTSKHWPEPAHGLILNCHTYTFELNTIFTMFPEQEGKF